MSRQIPISPKHGVNPSLMLCFFCGESKGMALLGKLKGDVEAPHSAIFDYEPCEKCREKFKQGVLLLEVDTVPIAGDWAPIQQQENQKLYPTGRHCVITKEAAKRIFGTEEDTLLVEVGVLAKLMEKEDADEEVNTTTVKDDSFDEIISNEGEEDEAVQEN